MPFGDLDGWRYAYTDVGTGPAIVFIHGIQMDQSMWDEQVDVLKDRFRVVTIDAPGHGESATAGDQLDFWRYAEMVARVLDQLGIDSAVWAGQSMGGFTALRAALALPDRVKALILIDTQARAEDPEKLAQYEAFLTVALEHGVTADLAGVVLLIYFGETFASKPESDVWRKKLEASDVHAQHAMIRAVFDRDSVHDRLGEIRCPALVIHGDEDVAIEHERGAEMAEMLGARFVLVPGAGHASPSEQPELVSAAITEFLTEIES